MSIRVKLLLSYAAMLAVPLIMMILTTLLLVFVFRGDLLPLKNIFQTQLQSLDNDNLSDQLKHTAKSSPSLLTNRKYLDDLAGGISGRGQSLYIRVNDEPYYVSPALEGKTELLQAIPSFTGQKEREELPVLTYGGDLYAVSQFDFMSAQGKASLFVLSKTDPLLYTARKFFPVLLISLLVILVLTHVLLTTLMSRRIIRPLRRLERAAGEITEGNLDFTVDIGGKDEIGKLGVAFVNIRIRLPSSIKLQQQYEENRKELITSISHDLRTPLTSIQGYVDGIMEGVANSPEKADRYLRTISLKTEEMSHLIDELFLYSKLDLKSIPFHCEEVSLTAFASDWVDELGIELEERGAELDASIEADGEWTIKLDRDKFKRVLGNIIQNSLRYSDKPDLKITVRVSAGGGQAVVEVGDNGPGIPPEALPHIFDRFFRAEESRSAKTGGSGLGLAIAKQIMEGLGGSIAASSAPGAGTRISLVLPAVRKGEGEA
jgi:signal transduction histidine kinase